MGDFLHSTLRSTKTWGKLLRPSLNTTHLLRLLTIPCPLGLSQLLEEFLHILSCQKKIRFVLAAKTPLKTNRFIRDSSLLRGRSRAVDKLRPFSKVFMAIFFERIVGWRCDLSSTCDVLWSLSCAAGKDLKPTEAERTLGSVLVPTRHRQVCAFAL